MKITDTFIAIADDSPATMGVIPPVSNGERTIARLHYELLSEHPYEFDLDGFNFEVYCLKNRISPDHREGHRAAFFSKGHPCMRASPLTKTYGYGAHYNGSGKIAIYPVDSIAYKKFLSDPQVKVEKAMRARRHGKPQAAKSTEMAGAHPGRGPEGVKPAA